MTKGLTVIIPAFNEAQAISSVIDNVHSICSNIITEIIVIDDGSSDETSFLAQQTGAKVLIHKQNRGYGASLKTGIRHAKTDFVLTMDADGQHRAEDILYLWEMVDNHDMVVGQRTKLIHSSLWRMPGKLLLGIMANYLTQRRIPDLNSGLRIIRREVALRYLHLCPAGFSFSTTITMALLIRSYSVAYLPIQVEKRVGKSTVSLKTGLNTIIMILRIAALFNPLRVFLPLSILIGGVGLAWGIPYTLAGRGISVGTMLALVTAILLFGLGILCDQISQLRLERFE
ncbi:MAG: glycosyltransferase [Symploca sp. SIO2D2]|nr:glycosyltransferase [Symploca sp. SIO2D2]